MLWYKLLRSSPRVIKSPASTNGLKEEVRSVCLAMGPERSVLWPTGCWAGRALGAGAAPATAHHGTGLQKGVLLNEREICSVGQMRNRYTKTLHLCPGGEPRTPARCPAPIGLPRLPPRVLHARSEPGCAGHSDIFGTPPPGTLSLRKVDFP